MTISAPVLAPYLARTASPIGRLEIGSDGEHITSLSIERHERLPRETEPERTTALLEAAVVQLGEYFAGARRSFDLPVLLTGTTFQVAVWQRLQQLAWSEYTSYGRLGLDIGRPGSGRAIGGAVGANPVPLIVPCHRVLAANRRITGYSGGNGIPTKIWLLDHEGIEHAA